MDFVKVEGLGNDFITIIEPIDPNPDQIVAWCARHTGVGADGVLEMTPIDATRVRMRYWNADGGEVGMCGNGLRCVALLALTDGYVDGAEFVVESAVGDHPVSVRDDGSVKAFVGVPHAFRTEEMTVAGQTVRPVGVGNPHAVLYVDNVEEIAVAEIGPRIGSDPIFPDGANVEFVATTGEDRIRVRVWERGVGETTGSGTGAAASAFAKRATDGLGDAITVELPGGDLLVEFDDAGAWMTGPARIVYRGEL